MEKDKELTPLQEAFWKAMALAEVLFIFIGGSRVADIRDPVIAVFLGVIAIFVVWLTRVMVCSSLPDEVMTDSSRWREALHLTLKR